MRNYVQNHVAMIYFCRCTKDIAAINHVNYDAEVDVGALVGKL